MGERLMKESGIEWVGKIPTDWLSIRNKNCFDISKTIVGKECDNTQLLSLTTKGVIEKNPDEMAGKVPTTFATYQKVKLNQIVMCLFDLDCSAVFSGISNYNGMISPAYRLLNCKKNILPKFADYWFSFVFVDRKYMQFSKNVRYSVSEDEFGPLPIITPPLPEQKKIAEFLDIKCLEIDFLAKDIQTQIKLLKEYKTSFIDEVFSKYQKEYGEDSIKLVRLSTLITKQTGFDYAETIKPSLLTEESEETLPFIQTKNFRNNYFSYETDYFIPKKIAYLFPNIVLKHKCLLFSLSGSIGNLGVFPALKEAFIGGAICKVDLKDKDLCDYIKFYAMSSKCQNTLSMNIFKSAQSNITVEDIRNLKIPVFTKDVMMTISNTISIFSDKIDDIILDKQKQLEILSKYKKSLIYEYVTGKKEAA